MKNKINPSDKFRIDAESSRSIKLIIGLGNPGKNYEKTYHNVGFLFIKYLSGEKSTKVRKFEFIRADNKILIKPLTFMNDSGEAVKEAVKYFGIKPEEILIIHDDSDIELGKFKLSFGRGSAGHKGIESIIQALKTSTKDGSALGGKNFWRLRIGIRHGKKADLPLPTGRQAPKARKTKAGEFVLTKISKANQEILENVFEEALNETRRIFEF